MTVENAAELYQACLELICLAATFRIIIKFTLNKL